MTRLQQVEGHIVLNIVAIDYVSTKVVLSAHKVPHVFVSVMEEADDVHSQGKSFSSLNLSNAT